MKYYIIVGEASGDLHGSNLIKHIFERDAEADIRAWGGDLMEAEGADVVKHYRDLAFMGFVEVAANLRTILKNFDICKADILKYQPDVLILIDYPGFNLRMAKFAHQNGIKVFYYISPQIWAWKQSRVKQIKAYVDEMYVILPFEKDFYAKFGMDVTFVGHPLIDAVEHFKKDFSSRESFLSENELDDRPVIAILPGSRKQEISKMLPLMLNVSKGFPEYQFVIAGAPSQDPEYYETFIAGSGMKIIFGKTYQLLTYSHSAMVTSGTATLETAIFRVPQVVCYRGGALSVIIARLLVKIKYIALVNLIMDREVVKELIQSNLNKKTLSREFEAISQKGNQRDKMLADYQELYEKLGGKGTSDLTAKLMLKTLGIKNA
ncbi:lipid-A-disaccharide synthase [Cryomorpha ignava]|uniref:Lipid-A-disaccharide synthase n=1 Tax=Cryomorpha ignava TaxID=101383 RepID=A0A7K3WKK6_9FLAO|nr:lipid-A-disaccharide synthase [Cryomorpha ignava]NEN22180.1 lipid-A-disaccharide synthase [Cryomorpha ignava]